MADPQVALSRSAVAAYHTSLRGSGGMISVKTTADPWRFRGGPILDAPTYQSFMKGGHDRSWPRKAEGMWGRLWGVR
jgi:hypothetical protein